MQIHTHKHSVKSTVKALICLFFIFQNHKKWLQNFESCMREASAGESAVVIGTTSGATTEDGDAKVMPTVIILCAYFIFSNCSRNNIQYFFTNDIKWLLTDFDFNTMCSTVFNNYNIFNNWVFSKGVSSNTRRSFRSDNSRSSVHVFFI